jgi:hypothetical protein
VTPAPTATPAPTPDALSDVHFLEVSSPQPDPDAGLVFVSEPTLVVLGRTRVDAAVTVSVINLDIDLFVEVDEGGRFEATVQLEEGLNFIEVVASVASGEELCIALDVDYEP